MNPSIGADDKADPDTMVLLISLQQRVGRRQRLWRAHVSAARNSEGFRNGSEFGDMGRHAAQILFYAGELRSVPLNARGIWGQTPAQQGVARAHKQEARHQ